MTVQLGLIGPAGDDLVALRGAAEFLLGDAGAEQVIYLGHDGAAERMAAEWARELMNGEASEDAFLERAALVAKKGSAEAIESLLAADVAVGRLSAIRTLPPPPARAVEMIDDRIVLVVHDKGILDEEDIANAHLIVYGKSSKSDLRKFGPRYFFTPGPLSAHEVALLELEPSGRLALALFDTAGTPLWREALHARAAKMTVAT